MAERAYETPHHFSRYVVVPNENYFAEHSMSLHAAFNAVMSSDALAGHIYYEAHRSNKTECKSDHKYKELLAGEDENFRIIRDVANSLKHIKLDRHDPVVTFASQTKVSNRGYGTGGFGLGTYGGEEVMIKLNNGMELHALTVLIQANEFLRSKIGMTP